MFLTVENGGHADHASKKERNNKATLRKGQEVAINVIALWSRNSEMHRSSQTNINCRIRDHKNGTYCLTQKLKAH